MSPDGGAVGDGNSGGLMSVLITSAYDGGATMLARDDVAQRRGLLSSSEHQPAGKEGHRHHQQQQHHQRLQVEATRHGYHQEQTGHCRVHHGRVGIRAEELGSVRVLWIGCIASGSLRGMRWLLLVLGLGSRGGAMSLKGNVPRWVR